MAKSLMIQGTASGVGKSIITTGICRILKQDGYSVATFKAQNMSNNAFTLENGLEMAKSQAIAAYACGIEPHHDMNPILLKILQSGTEVILHGKSIGSMDSEDYKRYKKNIWPEILEPYQRIDKQYQAIILEGAGSPVEMNLKSHDIVNMSLAQRIKAPVVLVSDIDRGGVFASVKGTLELLTGEERALVRGIIINKCKGSREFFVEVKQTMEEITQIPVLGMVPYTRIDIEDEDNLIDAEVGLKTAKDLAHMNTQFDLLANMLKENLDMKKLYQILEEGVL